MPGMTRTTPHPPVTLVTAASGKTGRRVAARLAARGVPVRPASRAAAPRFDWDDASTWDAALTGCGAAYLAYAPDLAVPGADATMAAFAERAVALGVGRLVLLSGRGEPGALRCEEAVRRSGAAVTVVRSSWFSQDFSESFLLDGVLAGEVAAPVGAVREPFVDADDVADVAVAALTGDGHAGRVYEVTGPALLTFADAVAAIAAATGRDVRFASVPLDAYLAVLADAGVPADVAGLMHHLFAEVLDGRNAHLTDGVRRALGRPPRAFADYARSTAASGVWGAPASHHRVHSRADVATSSGSSENTSSVTVPS